VVARQRGLHVGGTNRVVVLIKRLNKRLTNLGKVIMLWWRASVACTCVGGMDHVVVECVGNTDHVVVGGHERASLHLPW